MKNEIVKHMT